MADIGALLEAEKRGLLPQDKLDALKEARTRGLVPQALDSASAPASPVTRAPDAPQSASAPAPASYSAKDVLADLKGQDETIRQGLDAREARLNAPDVPADVADALQARAIRTRDAERAQQSAPVAQSKAPARIDYGDSAPQNALASSDPSMLRDVAIQAPQGFNTGLDNLYNLPNHAVNFLAQKLGYEPPITPVRLASRFNTDETPQTSAGELAHNVGEFAGGSVIPFLGTAARSANALRYPAAALKDYITSSIGGGAGQAVARNTTLGDVSVPVPGYGDVNLGPAAEATLSTLGALGGPAALSGMAAAGRGVGTLGRLAAGNEGGLAKVATDREMNALAQAKVDPNTLLERVVPAPKSAHVARGIDREDIANMIIRQKNGESANAIAQDYPGDPTRGIPAVRPQAIRNYLSEYNEDNITPTNIIDLAKEVRSPGGAAPVTRLGKAAQGLSPDSDAAAALEDRQAGQSGRVRDIIQKATSDDELARRLKLTEDDYRASIGKPTGALTRAENTALKAQQTPVQRAFKEQRDSGREMEFARADLAQRSKAKFEKDYQGLYGPAGAPNAVIADDELGDLLSQPLARSHWQKANELAQSEGYHMPTSDELAKSFGGRSKVGIDLNQEGTPGAGLTDEARFNLRDKALTARIDAARTAGEDPHDLEMLREGLRDQRVTKSTGQYQDQNYPAPIIPVRALDYFQRALRNGAKSSDVNVNQSLGNIRRNLLEKLDPETPGATNPTLVPGFRKLMNDYRESRVGDEAFDLGHKMATGGDASQRETARQFESLTPDDKHLARMGYSRGLMDRTTRGFNQNAVDPLMNQGDHEMIGRVFSKDRAEDMIDKFNRENYGSGTKNDILRGSQTADKSFAMQRNFMQGAREAADVALMRPYATMRNLSNRLAYHIGEKQAGQVIRDLTTTKPEEMLQKLVDYSRNAKTAGAREAYRQAISEMRGQMRGSKAIGATANALAQPDAQIEYQNPNSLSGQYQNMLDQGDAGARAVGR